MEDIRPPVGLDPYAPSEIAQRVESAGIAKAAMPAPKTVVLAVLAGAFIAFGAMFYTIVVTGSGMGFGPTRLMGGVAFSLGLVLVLVGGAELFTGNNLIVMAWAERRVPTARLLRNWGLVYLGNAIGAIATAVVMHLAGALEIGGSGVGETAVAIAQAKLALGPGEAFFRGLLCNTLVCLAVWLSMSAHEIAGKILAIVFPVAAFVALGFEHSIANLYLIPVGMMAAPPELAGTLTMAGFLGNLIPVTFGNIVGGSIFVALVYWLVYLRE